MKRSVEAILALSFLLASCGPPAGVILGVGVTAPTETVVLRDSPGPNWAVASGARRQGYFRYRYYQHSNVYYDVDRRMYFYPDPASVNWQMTASLPTRYAIQEDDMVELDVHSEQPSRYHSEIVGHYPPGQAKKQGKGNKDHRGKGPGEKKDNQGHWD